MLTKADKRREKMDKIIKRDGRIVDYDISKIENAIVKAMLSLGEGDVRGAGFLSRFSGAAIRCAFFVHLCVAAS